MHLVYFFTYDYSLKSWKDSRIYSRETKIFHNLVNSGVKLTLVTYGDKSEFEYVKDLNGIEIIPIYSIISKSNIKIINIIKSIFLVPFYLEKIKNADVLMHNQLLGTWLTIILKKFLKIPILLRTGYDMYRFSIFENKWFFKKFLYFYLPNYHYLIVKYSL